MEQQHRGPLGWTEIDQEIIEHLLFPDGGVASSDPYSPSGYRYESSSVIAPTRTPPEPLSVEFTGDTFTFHLSPKPPARTRKSDEYRRAKHREVQRRFMQRKKEALEKVKQQAIQLEKKVALLRVVSEEVTLKQENDALLKQYQIASATSSKEGINRQLEDEITIAQSLYELISEAEWTEEIRRMLGEIDCASSDPSFVTLGFTVMGWNDRRKIEGSTLKFIMSKEFPHLRPLTFLNDTWEKILSPQHYAKFFSPSLHIKMGILQRINDNAVVMYRVIHNPQTHARSRSVELFARLRVKSDYILISHSLEAPSVESGIGEPSTWSRVSTWLQYSPLTTDNSTGCHFRYGGCYRKVTSASLKYWLAEIFFMSVRFESVMAKPVFMICD